MMTRSLRHQYLPITVRAKHFPCHSLQPVAHTCNPHHSGDRDQEDHCSKSAWANSSQDLSKKTKKKNHKKTKKGWWSGLRCRPGVQTSALQKKNVPLHCQNYNHTSTTSLARESHSINASNINMPSGKKDAKILTVRQKGNYRKHSIIFFPYISILCKILLTTCMSFAIRKNITAVLENSVRAPPSVRVVLFKQNSNL
jgi:hypothetical protein